MKLALNEDEDVEFLAPRPTMSAEQAAHYVKTTLEMIAQQFGLFPPAVFQSMVPHKEWGPGTWVLVWSDGPTQWADGFCVQAGSSGAHFCTYPINGNTVCFEQLN